MTILSEKEFTLINRIGNNNSELTQRQIAQHTGFSLGLTNLILRRLAKKGYVKVKQLTHKKMRYILTSKGMIEKTKKSYGYICKVIKEMQYIKNVIIELLRAEYQKGNKVFGILGNGELAGLVELCSDNFPDIKTIRIDSNNFYNTHKDEVNIMLDCQDFPDKGIAKDIKSINLIDYIAALK